MVCTSPCPTMDMMVNRISSPGIDIQESTNRWVARSTLPPTKPEAPPIAHGDHDVEGGRGQANGQRNPVRRRSGGSSRSRPT